MFNCPYCGSKNIFVDNTGSRTRNNTHTVVKCVDCVGFSVRLHTDKVLPLADRTYVDADVVSRIVD